MGPNVGANMRGIMMGGIMMGGGNNAVNQDQAVKLWLMLLLILMLKYDLHLSGRMHHFQMGIEKRKEKKRKKIKKGNLHRRANSNRVF
jgi:hypothetical protein